MYCPQCATPLANEQKFCRSCGFDLQMLSKAFALESKALESSDGGRSRNREAKLRFRGTITLMSAFLVGCLIPISLGLFRHWSGMTQLILVLSGLAGVLLFAGIITLVYADSLPNTPESEEPFRVITLPGAVPTNQLPPADEPEPIPGITERTTGLLVDVPREKNHDRG